MASNAAHDESVEPFVDRLQTPLAGTSVENCHSAVSDDDEQIEKPAILATFRQSISEGNMLLNVSEADQHLTSFTRADYFKIKFAFIFPGVFALCPILMPFGTPFAKDGNNSIIENWAYYFWYTPIGWGLLWMKLALWNCAIFGQDFFLPFMQERKGIFKATRALIPVLAATLCSTVSYVGGYLIFQNPVPLGTLSFGVFGFLVTFVGMYLFLVPTASRVSRLDHIRIIRCWAPFLIWYLGLLLYTYGIWVKQKYSANDQHGLAENHTTLGLLVPVCIQAYFIGIRFSLTSVPVGWLMGNYNEDIALLWLLAYGTMCACMSAWIFPQTPHNLLGIASAMSVMVLNVTVGLVIFCCTTDPVKRIKIFMYNLCDVVAGWAFIFIFIYSAFGPNQDFIYCITGMSQQRKLGAVVMICINFCFNVLKLAIMFQIARRTYDLHLQIALVEFGLQALRHYYWPVIILLSSTSLACGACMVMMHDGMDLSFSFREWEGAWPFNQHA